MLLSVNDLRVTLAGVEIVRGLTLDIAPGRTLGIVGESGSGKSITWAAILGLLGAEAKVRGSVQLGGEELVGARWPVLQSVRGRRIALVFQDPSGALNPMRTIGAQIDEVVALHRNLHGRAVREETCRLLGRVGIPNPPQRAAAYPHELSGGQNQRVAIAMALAGAPELLVADEPTTALDPTIQAQILELLQDVQRETGMALVLISHDMSVVAEICDTVAVMYAGKIVEQGPAARIFGAPAHPYTRALLASLPMLDGPKRPLTAIRGSMPHGEDVPRGCAFGPRCDAFLPACARPQATHTLAPDHLVLCHRAGEIG